MRFNEPNNNVYRIDKKKFIDTVRCSAGFRFQYRVATLHIKTYHYAIKKKTFKKIEKVLSRSIFDIFDDNFQNYWKNVQIGYK